MNTGLTYSILYIRESNSETSLGRLLPLVVFSIQEFKIKQNTVGIFRHEGKKINILYILNVVRETSSPLHEHIIPMANHHNVTVVSYNEIEVELPGQITVSSAGCDILRYIKLVNSTLNSLDCNVVHLHAPHSAFLFYLFLAISLKLGKIKTVYTVHSSYKNYQLKHKLMLYFIFLCATKIVHCSESSFFSFGNTIWKKFLKKRVVIRNGVNVESIDKVLGESDVLVPQTSESMQCTMSLKLITIGRLISVKNHTLLLKSLSNFNNNHYRLQIIGVGPLIEELQELAKNLRIDESVDFIGLVSREEVYRRLSKSDLFLSTSVLEGLPISVLESLACSCPAILSDIPSHREIAENDSGIILVDSNDEQGFVSAIRGFIGRSQIEKGQLAIKGRQFVENNYSLESMKSEYQRLFNML